MPELPTVAEAGVPGYACTTWYGVLAPAATLKPVIAKLHQSVVKVLAGRELREKFTSQGLEVQSAAPGQLSVMVIQEVARWEKIIRGANIRGE